MVGESVCIQAKMLELNIRDAAKTDTFQATEEDIEAKLIRLRMLIDCADAVKAACEQELQLWENLNNWFGNQNSR
jgi:hypothetical protein